MTVKEAKAVLAELDDNLPLYVLLPTVEDYMTEVVSIHYSRETSIF